MVYHDNTITACEKLQVVGYKGQCLLMRKYFCAVYDYAGKVDLSKGYWNPKRKFGVITHFSEIIKKEYFKKVSKYKAMHGLFSKIEA